MVRVELECVQCGAVSRGPEDTGACAECGGGLEVVLDLSRLRYAELKHRWRDRRPGVWRYRELLPLNGGGEVTLSEGGTALLQVDPIRLGEARTSVFVKNEGQNPTGSFKDRGMTVGATRAHVLARRRVICASTGNTAASLAAYAARGGMECIVLVPSGGIARGKLAQAVFQGGRVVAIRGSFDDAMSVVVEVAKRLEAYVLNSINPFRIEGQKTGAFEVFEQLGDQVPDWLVCPVGNGGNLAAYWKGFQELRTVRATDRLPRLVAVQAVGASPIVDAVNDRKDVIAPIAAPETVASAIRIGNPANAPKTLRAIRESDGLAIKVSDEAILKAQSNLARGEGIFVEPAAAASIAGVVRLAEDGVFEATDRIVCVCTGHGLKDPDTALRSFAEPKAVEPAVDSIVAAVEDARMPSARISISG